MGDAGPTRAMGSMGTISALSPRQASVLCYVPWVGWIVSILVLAAPKFRPDRVVRFHAFQGLYLFAAYLVDVVAIRQLDPLMVVLPVSRLFEIIIVAASIFVMVRTAQGVVCSLPLFGELAHRSAHESWPGN
ncbi:MAG TPA: hypothetical protein VKF41_03445 [Bryobacteraceae bacterium]|nr:hypothetical protein [Bryobacteraceae bacterium]